jgi:hypothetical protein
MQLECPQRQGLSLRLAEDLEKVAAPDQDTQACVHEDQCCDMDDIRCQLQEQGDQGQVPPELATGCMEEGVLRLREAQDSAAPTPVAGMSGD